ncbi:kinetochore protein Spc24-like isoform X2 [Homarus americanus]|uniref:Kinetochore protein Spc24 n=2 Tax=Homarus americanus TaxID=6706 RepID=A0A8J5JW20_HOMAM|nr:kinetochore protein Spc24-like isoform X2 [Homarus americanus]XP_042237176.1 kinetochore protein Spc24-like isoform X2 [Homarus americanus]XP_042237177.1 kinetochore protein Spc24-like isoform X2 [Homarus americanus]KAG7160329.1 Kinetochore protein Spc24-like [Homarus americanus]
MQENEGEANTEREMKVLNEMTFQAMSLVANSKVGASFSAAKDGMVTATATVDYELQSMKEIIKDLLCMEETEMSVLDDIRSQTQGPQAGKLLSELAQANRKKGGIEEEIDSLASRINHMEQLEQQLNTRMMSSSQQTSAIIPKIKADVATLTKISHLKWDYSAPSDTVKGFIYQTEKKDIIPFKFDKSSHTQFFITNYLWQQIGANEDFLA